MQNGIILSSADVKKILAEYFEVGEDDIICTKYSYVVKKDKELSVLEVK